MSRRKEQERLKGKGAAEERWNRSRRRKKEEQGREKGKVEKEGTGAERRELGAEASPSAGEERRRQQCSSSTLIDSLNNQSS